jgi:hypothetical protein
VQVLDTKRHRVDGAEDAGTPCYGRGNDEIIIDFGSFHIQRIDRSSDIDITNREAHVVPGTKSWAGPPNL